MDILHSPDTPGLIKVKALAPSATGTVCAVGADAPVPPLVAFTVPVISNFSLMPDEFTGVTVKLAELAVLVVKLTPACELLLTAFV